MIEHEPGSSGDKGFCLCFSRKNWPKLYGFQLIILTSCLYINCNI